MSESPGISEETVPLPFCMLLFAIAAGTTEDPIVRVGYRKTLAVQNVDRQFVSYAVELMRWFSPRAYVATKHKTPYVERNLLVFERGSMKGGESRHVGASVFGSVRTPVRRYRLFCTVDGLRGQLIYCFRAIHTAGVGVKLWHQC